MSQSKTDFARLLSVDALLIKATGMDTDAVLMNMERRLFRSMFSAWRDRARSTIDSAVKTFASGASKQAVLATISHGFSGLVSDVKGDVEVVTMDAYLEGKRQMLAHSVRKAKDPSLEPKFTLRDEKAVNQLIDGQLHWIGEFYYDDMAESIDGLISEVMLESGLGRAEAGKLLDAKLSERLVAAGIQIPVGFINKPGAYFEIIAANTVSNARVRGSLGQMAQIGVTNYTIVAAGDERTCERCRFMDGRSVAVQRAVEVMTAIDNADSPEQVKDLHPWAAKLAEMEANPNGFPFPPFHGSCRCTVDIAENSEISFDPLPGW